jgi:hypothetical protein
VAAGLDAPAAPRWCPDTAGSETARPHPGAARRSRRPPRRGRLALSAPFGFGIGIVNRHGAALALAHRAAGRAPRPRPLPTPAGVAQHVPDREGADLRQAIRGPPQTHQRPRRRPVPPALGRTARFGQDALPLGAGLASSPPAAMSGHQCLQPHLVEACHQPRDGIARASSGRVSRSHVVRCHARARWGPSCRQWILLGDYIMPT